MYVRGFLGKGGTILGHYGQWGMGLFSQGLLGKGTGAHWGFVGLPTRESTAVEGTVAHFS